MSFAYTHLGLSNFFILESAEDMQMALDASARANLDTRGTQANSSAIYASILPGAKSFYQYAPITTLPSDLILAILHGDLPSKMQDPAFAERVGPFVELTDCPSIYAVFVAQVGGVDAGKGLTLREMVTVIETYYTVRRGDPSDKALIEDTRKQLLSAVLQLFLIYKPPLNYR